MLLQEYKLYLYHSKELKTRFLYLILTLLFSFSITFLNMEFLLYKLLPKIKNTLPEQGFMEITNSTWITSLQQEWNSADFIFTEIFEAFFSYLLLSGYLSFILLLPILYYHIYKFLLPGLTYTEASFIKIVCILSLSLLIFAHLLTYNIIIPYATSFLLTFQSAPQTLLEFHNTHLYNETIQPPIGGVLEFTDISQSTTTSINQTEIVNETKFTESNKVNSLLKPQLTFLGRIYPWITFSINLFTTVTFLFQLPLFLFILFLYFFKQKVTTQFIIKENNKLDPKETIPNTIFFNKKQINSTFLRKILFFTLIVLTAVFSPPDLYSQLVLFIPLFLVIEIFIFAIFIYFEYVKSRFPKI